MARTHTDPPDPTPQLPLPVTIPSVVVTQEALAMVEPAVPAICRSVALRLIIPPAPPLRGDIVMFPVVFPPIVRVLFLND